MESTCLVPHGTSCLHYQRRKTIRSHQVIRHRCTVTGVMVEDIGLLIIQPGNVFCVAGMDEARNCKSSVPRSGGQIKYGNPVVRNEVSAGCLVQSSPPHAMAEDIQACIEGEQLFLACGKKIPLLSSACV